MRTAVAAHWQDSFGELSAAQVLDRFTVFMEAWRPCSSESTHVQATVGPVRETLAAAARMLVPGNSQSPGAQPPTREPLLELEGASQPKRARTAARREEPELRRMSAVDAQAGARPRPHTTARLISRTQPHAWHYT